jgi:hypothetical protein
MRHLPCRPARAVLARRLGRPWGRALDRLVSLAPVLQPAGAEGSRLHLSDYTLSR